MIDYIGIKCPVCDKDFETGNDIVVCPVCGAPYHRHCYKEKGECVFPELHEGGEDWKPPVVEVEKTNEATAYEIKDQECHRCGVLNSHSATHCSICNESLKAPKSASQDYSQTVTPPPMFINPMSDPLGGVNPSDDIKDNVNAAELSKIVQQNTAYYIPVFRNIAKFNKNKFNFIAFLFSGPWLLYRKQYKTGAIITALIFLLYITQRFILLTITVPAMMDTLRSLGQSVDSTGLTTEQMTLLAANMTADDFVFMLLPLAMSVIMLVIMLVVGFKANKMYLNHCVKTVDRLRKTADTSEDFNTSVFTAGGVNTSITILVFVCYLLSTYLPNFFL